jgi:hypothetical protein
LTRTAGLPGMYFEIPHGAVAGRAVAADVGRHPGDAIVSRSSPRRRFSNCVP